MRNINDKFQGMLASVPKSVMTEVDISFAIADSISRLMRERGITKKQLADALGKNPSEVTKWLSGQHNFTIRTIAMLSAFFGSPIIYTSVQQTSLDHVAEGAATYNDR